MRSCCGWARAQYHVQSIAPAKGIVRPVSASSKKTFSCAWLDLHTCRASPPNSGLTTSADLGRKVPSELNCRQKIKKCWGRAACYLRCSKRTKTVLSTYSTHSKRTNKNSHITQQYSTRCSKSTLKSTRARHPRSDPNPRK